ncbi:hypothetical protein [Devosia riboflavina]|uniref:hypothetical protein n=1 Tax=Devosia riboflavina TaxID=46914 RepID=UPI00068F74BC|nr:hypothetical protein [Devosia riboflavina]
MKRKLLSILPLVFVASVSAPAQAQNLLGIIGGSGEDALVTLGSGDASNTGLVNVGLGGENQLVDAQIGGSSGIANATVGSGGGSALGANANVLGGAATVGATVGGGSLVDADVGLLNGTVGVGATVGGGSLANIGVSIGGGAPGNPGNPGNGGGNGGVGNGGIPSFSASNGGNAPACAGTSPRQVERLIQGTQIGGSWQRASNVEIQRVDMCPELQTWLAAALTNSGLGNSLRSAISSDSLLSASIDRSSYNANRVFAVHQRGNQLTVFVY